MGPILAIAFGAGLASALLFATLASGNVLALVLFYFAALPVLIAGLGWGHYAGGFAAAIGALALSFAFRSQFGLFFFFTVGLPAWGLSYVTLAGRMAPGEQRIVWTQPGTLLSLIAIAAVLLTAFGIAMLFGFDHAAYQASLRAAVERTLARMPVTGADREAVIAVMVAAVPIAAAVVWTFVTTINLYIAGRVVRASGRLARPWPDLASLRLPKWMAVMLLIGSIGSFAPGYPGHFAGIMLAVSLAAFSLQGYALAHDMTRGWDMRGFALGLLYALTFLISWLMVFVALAGLADTLFDLRSRRAPPATKP